MQAPHTNPPRLSAAPMVGFLQVGMLGGTSGSAMVMSVLASSPADVAGLAVNDVIIGVDGADSNVWKTKEEFLLVLNKDSVSTLIGLTVLKQPRSRTTSPVGQPGGGGNCSTPGGSPTSMSKEALEENDTGGAIHGGAASTRTQDSLASPRPQWGCCSCTTVALVLLAVAAFVCCLAAGLVPNLGLPWETRIKDWAAGARTLVEAVAKCLREAGVFEAVPPLQDVFDAVLLK